jgi:hypothetical protein
MAKSGNLELLNDPIAQTLLHSTIPARVGYVWHDGTPRVIPIWFHWNGAQVVMGTPMKAPKLGILETGAKVSLSIDSTDWPYKVLQIRGTAQVETIAGVVPEYAAAAERYLGEEQGKAFAGMARNLFPYMGRIAVQPEWVHILDFEQRWPSAVAAAMAAARS